MPHRSPQQLTWLFILCFHKSIIPWQESVSIQHLASVPFPANWAITFFTLATASSTSAAPPKSLPHVLRLPTRPIRLFSESFPSHLRVILEPFPSLTPYKTTHPTLKTPTTMKKLLIISTILIGVCISACNVTRTITTQSQYYQRGDTSCVIQTKTIETYDASKKGL